jgi:hypothetical protein
MLAAFLGPLSSAGGKYYQTFVEKSLLWCAFDSLKLLNENSLKTLRFDCLKANNIAPSSNCIDYSRIY